MRSSTPPLSAASPDFGRVRNAVFTYPAFAEFFGTGYRFDPAAGDTSYLFYPGGHEVYFSRQRLSSENESPVQTHLLIREPGLLEFPFFGVNIGNTLLICHGNSRPFSCEINEALDCRKSTSKMHALLGLSIIGRDSLAFFLTTTETFRDTTEKMSRPTGVGRQNGRAVLGILGAIHVVLPENRPFFNRISMDAFFQPSKRAPTYQAKVPYRLRCLADNAISM